MYRWAGGGPLGSCVLHGLGRYGELLARGLVVNDYELADHAGQVIKRVNMSVLTGKVGPMVMIERAGLLDILREACAGVEIRVGVGIRSLAQDRDGVDVTLDDGTVERADLVAGCDGIDSATRALAGGPEHRYDTGWVLWTWWAAADHPGPPVFREWWGRGWFFGCYPAPGQLMCACGGPARQWDSPPAGRVSEAWPGQLKGLLRRFPPAAAAGEPPAMYRWPMRDVRASRWFHGRVALCGDAAAAFLPSAAVGASAAMRSAAALADELSRADAATVPAGPGALPEALPAHRGARAGQLAPAGADHARRPPGPAWGRDQLARRYPARLALSEIIHGSHQPF